MARKDVAAIVSRISNVFGVFQISLEGNATTSELVERGQYIWHNSWITDDRFPIQPHDLMRRTIKFIELDHDSSFEQVMEESRRHGLKRPIYEDALYFGIQHSEEQRKRLIVFPHEPVLGLGGSRYVLILHGGAGSRKLDLRLVADGWRRGCVFACVRE